MIENVSTTAKMKCWRVFQWFHIPLPKKTRKWIKAEHKETAPWDGSTFPPRPMVWKTDLCANGYPPYSNAIARATTIKQVLQVGSSRGVCKRSDSVL